MKEKVLFALDDLYEKLNSYEGIIFLLSIFILSVIFQFTGILEKILARQI